MSRVGVRKAMYLGGRTLLAMTCRTCDQLKPGSAFARRRCSNGTYVNRRCMPCTWLSAESSLGRNGTYR